MLKYRLISFPILIFLLGTIFYLDFAHPAYGRIFFAVIAAAAAFPTAMELNNIIKAINIPVLTPVIPGLLCAFSAIFAIFMPKYSYQGVMISATAFLLIAAAVILGSKDHDGAVKKVLGSMTVFFIVSLLLLPIAALHQRNLWWFLFCVLATKACDTGGYIAGMLSNKIMKNGNHKLAPAISPKKSWEGLAGGMILSLAVGVIFGMQDGISINLPVSILIAFILCLGSLAGDLTESALKRAAGIKDSGTWIPGMGGILDVIDSFIYNGPLLVLFLTWFK